MALAVLGRGRVARADPPTAASPTFAWVRGEGAESCPEGAALLAQIAHQLDANVAHTELPSIEGVVERRDGEWSARIYVRDRTTGALLGRREIHSSAATCGSIADSTALAAALVIGAEPAVPATPVAPPAPAPAPVRVVIVRPPIVRTIVVRPARTFELRAQLAVTGTAGVLPAPSLGLALLLDARVAGPFRVQAALGLLADVDARAPGARASDPAFVFGGSQAWLAGCLEPLRRGPVALDACVGALGGTVHAAASAPFVGDPSGAADRVWLGPVLDALLTVRLAGPLVATVGALVAAPLARYRFAIDADDAAHRVFEQSPVAATGWIALGVEAR